MCLLCSRPCSEDACVACQWLLRGDPLMRSWYRSLGGTFAPKLIAHHGPKPPKWRHGTRAGRYDYHCQCGPCAEAGKAAARDYKMRRRARRSAAEAA